MTAPSRPVAIPDSLRALLHGAIDYAGLFPPAALGMQEAVENYAAYLESSDAWALGRFVVPIARLDEFSAATAVLLRGRGWPYEPWPVSALSANEHVARDVELVSEFNLRHIGRAIVSSVEAPARTAALVAQLAEFRQAGLEVYIEVPIDGDVEGVIAAIALLGSRAKLRTGGVTVDAIPRPEAILRFIRACRDATVGFKATAGLHHAMRADYALTYAPDSVRGELFGYLNIFLAAAMLWARWEEQLVLQTIRERDREAFVFDGQGVRWHGRVLTAAAIADSRTAFLHGFGSCSFREPINELAALAVLE